jgi:hypothetical protein
MLLKTACLSLSSVSIRPSPVAVTILFCDASRGVPRPVIPVQAGCLQQHPLPGTSRHQGKAATARFLVVWQRMASDVAIWCRDCQACCRVKVTWQLVTPVTSIPVLLSHFSQIYMDVAVPLPRSSNNYADLFTITDRSTRWLEAVRLHNIDTASCVDTLLHHWIPRLGGSSCHHIQLEPSVCLFSLVCSVQAVGHQPYNVHSIPSTQQWHG